MQCMILKPNQPVILRIVSIVGRGWQIMNTMDMVIQILEPCIVEIVVLILGSIELMQLIEKQPFKVRLNRVSVF